MFGSDSESKIEVHCLILAVQSLDSQYRASDMLDQCFLTGYTVYPSVYQIKIKVCKGERVYEGYTASIWAPFLTQININAKKLILHIFYHVFHGKLY